MNSFKEVIEDKISHSNWEEYVLNKEKFLLYIIKHFQEEPIVKDFLKYYNEDHIIEYFKEANKRGYNPTVRCGYNMKIKEMFNRGISWNLWTILFPPIIYQKSIEKIFDNSSRLILSQILSHEITKIIYSDE